MAANNTHKQNKEVLL